MILDQNQMDAIKRNGVIATKYRWANNTLVYELSSKHTKKQNDFIEKALSKIASVSCLKFKRRTDEKDFVRMQASDRPRFRFKLLLQ